MPSEPYVNRSYWTGCCEWADPDCIECDGQGAPCCEPPDVEYIGTICAWCAQAPTPTPEWPVLNPSTGLMADLRAGLDIDIVCACQTHPCRHAI